MRPASLEHMVEVEEDLLSSREQLRALSAHLQSVREEERIRIAREIHDNLGQSLTGLKMDISWLLKRLPANNSLLIARAAGMSEAVDALITLVQQITAELRPGVLDYFGLSAAIEWQAREFEGRTGITCIFCSDPEEIVLNDKNKATAIFRIFQELLTNIARHAEASSVTVVLKEDASQLTLNVRDNGRGIRQEELTSPQSFGLIGMRERAMVFDGEVAISGETGKGTWVMVKLPIKQADDTEEMR